MSTTFEEAQEYGRARGKPKTIKYRCTPKIRGGCGTRLTLPRPPQAYAHRPPRFTPEQWQALLIGHCPNCLTGKLYDVTPSVKRWTKKTQCDCAGPLTHPHNRGYSAGCLYSSNW